MDVEVKSNILVFNKLDLIKDSTSINYLKKKYPESIFISAKDHIMIDTIKEAVNNILSANQSIKTIKIPFEKTHLINKIYNQFDIILNTQKDGYTELKVSVADEEYKKIKKILKN